MALLFVAFIAGLLTVLAPCTLPLLPVIIGGSVNGESNFKRAFVVAASLGTSVFLFTILLKVSTLLIAVPQEFWNIVSGGLLMLFGLVTLFPKLWDRFSFAQSLNLSGNRLLAQGYTRQNFMGDIIVGAALGPVFSSCSPTYFIVLATVLPVHPAEGVLYLLAYSIGLIISLLAVSVLGQRIVLALGIASNPEGWFKRSIGALFLIIGFVVVTGYSTTIESDLLSHAGMFDVTQIEQRLLGTQNTSDTSQIGLLTPAQKTTQYQKAPNLAGIDGYFNTNGQPIKLSDYIGKNVVLVDFWTYSCINCLRTIPYLNAWYDKYKDQGLVIVGVHTPEFAFEHIGSNVQDAINRLGIKYPVVQDNEYSTWNAFGNEYWPNEYLIDIDGYIVDNHAGEGDYDKTEGAIQQALAERAVRLGIATSTKNILNEGSVSVQQADLSGVGSPETYFGSNRNEYFGNGTPGKGGTQTYTAPSGAQVQLNTFYLGGTWQINPEYAESESTGDIKYEYNSKDLYFVAAGDQGPVKIKVLRDGVPVGHFAGADVDTQTSEVTIQANRLYHLIDETTPGVHTIDIQVEGKGLEAYTFTFG